MSMRCIYTIGIYILDQYIEYCIAYPFDKVKLDKAVTATKTYQATFF